MPLRRSSPRLTPRRPPGTPMPSTSAPLASPNHKSTLSGRAIRQSGPRRGCPSASPTHTQKSSEKAVTNARFPPSRYRGGRNRDLNPAPPFPPAGRPTLGTALRTHLETGRRGNHSSAQDCGAHRRVSLPAWMPRSRGGHPGRTLVAGVWKRRRLPMMSDGDRLSKYSRHKCGRPKDGLLQMPYGQPQETTPHDLSAGIPLPHRPSGRRNRPSPPPQTRRSSHSFNHRSKPPNLPRSHPKRPIIRDHSCLRSRRHLHQNHETLHLHLLRVHTLRRANTPTPPRG